MKDTILALTGIAGAFVANAFGGWDASIATLLIFMAIDYITGLIVAAVFHNSPKTEGGALESKAASKGLIRKGMTLLIVLIGARLDLMLGAHYVRDGVVVAFVVNEALSILENAGLMGIDYPEPMKNAIELLRGKNDKDKPPDES